MSRVFSGIQPSGELHIGNYVGAVSEWARLMDEGHECYYCIVDYHAMTQPYDPEIMEKRVLEMAAGLMAAGIDPERAVLFVQSQVPEHTELAWMLMTVTPMGELSRQTQYKDKARRQEGNVNVGLFAYPVLQAADILLYKGELVPVGEDQRQHLELAREIVRKFRSRFGYEFPEPQPRFGRIKRLKGLDGRDKMSKSLGNTITLTETEDQRWEKLRTAFTDPARVRKSDPGHPEICNIYTMHTFFTPEEEREEIAGACRKGEIGCFECKKRLNARMTEHLAPIQDRYADLLKNISDIRDILRQGGKRARAVAQETVKEVRSAAGLIDLEGR